MASDRDFSSLFWLPAPPADFAARLGALGNQGDPLPEMRRLAGTGLNISQLRKLRSVSRRLWGEATGTAGPGGLRQARIGFVGSGTLDFLTDAVPGSGLRHGLHLETETGDFNAYAAMAYGANGGLTGPFDAVVVMLDYTAFSPPARLLDSEAHRAAVEEAMETVTRLVEQVGERFGCPVIIAPPVPDPGMQISASDLLLPGTMAGLLADIGKGIVQLCGDGRFVLWDLAALAARTGTGAWHDPVGRNVAKAPFALRLVPLVADSLCSVLAGLFGKARRGLILDLDNTVWGGVIGDDGLSGIAIGQGNAAGEGHLAVQRTALELHRRGIVLAVCSKNDDAVARLPFREHPDMLLREEHIAVFQANWNDKATNVASIAATLSLGTDAFVFLDDNPAERQRVRQELPEVVVPEVPDDPSWLAACLVAPGYFENAALNEEDLARAAAYQGNARRAEIRTKIGNYEDYLKSLEMELTVSRFDAVGRGRIAQLVGKSNQFNLTTRRYGELALAAMEDDPAVVGLQVRLVDKFGDNGMISVIILRLVGETLYVDTWLMSCRVLERGVEKAVHNQIAEMAHRMGASRIVGHYIPTDRNAMVAGHYESLGFAPLDGPLPEDLRPLIAGVPGETFHVDQVADRVPHACHMTVSPSV